MNAAVLVAYAFAVALILATAAWLLERALSNLRLPLRGAWAGALGLSIALPMAALLSAPSEQVGTPTVAARTVVDIGELEIGDPTSVADVIRRSAPLVPFADLTAALSRWTTEGAALLPAGRAVEGWIAGAWAVASMLTAVILLGSMVRLRRRIRACPEASLLGRSVKLSRALGPATVGILDPVIVLPRWSTRLDPDELELILRHEEEHVGARDTLLLAVGLVAAAACPWNPAVWWQVRRLKAAVEVDCDRRVLEGGVAPHRYGDLLIRVGTRGPVGPIAIPTMAASISLLERRLTAMMKLRGEVPVLKVLGTASAALLLVAIACSTEAPAGMAPQRVSGPPEKANPAVDSDPQGEDVLAARIVVDRDGSVRVNEVLRPLTAVAEAVAALSTPNAVVSLQADPAVSYRVVAAVQDQLREAELLRVVFTAVEPEARSSLPRDVSTLVEEGLAIVLPDMTIPPIDESWVSSRNLMFLEVLPTGRVLTRFGDDPRQQSISAAQVEGIWRYRVAENPNLIAVVRTHPDAEYRHMYAALDALLHADAKRFTLQTLAP